MTRLRHLGLESSSRKRMRFDRRSRRFRKGFLLALLSILVLLCPSLAGVASAGVNVWTTNGPDGGAIRALAIDPANPATLYAGTSGGSVFKSTNGGGSWRAVITGLTGPSVIPTGVTALAIDPSTPATLYAGTFGSVVKSTNGGASWTAANTGLTNTGVWALAIDPSAPATLYAGTSAHGVFKSTNGGGSWSEMNTGLGISPWDFGPAVTALAIDPSAPARLYAGTSDGVFKSNGGSWTAIDAGLTNTSVYALAIDRGGVFDYGETLYAGTLGGVFKSTNGGETWTVINAGLTNTVVRTLAVDPSTPATLYAGTEGSGVFRTSNGGESWTAINTGLTSVVVQALAIDSSTPATLYAATEALYAGTEESGVFKSSNGGESWTAINAGLTSSVVLALAIDPSTPATLYAGTEGNGVFKSSNGGESWTAIDAGMTSIFVNALAIDPSAPATLYAGTFDGGVFKSTNGGGSWAAINAGLTNTVVNTLAIDPLTPSTLYAGGYGGVFKSTNGGGSWAAINAGLTTVGYVSALAIDPSAPATIYAGAVGGVFKSTNGGGSWSPINTGLTNPNVNALAIDPSAPATIFAGVSDFGLGSGAYKSTNGGESWTALFSGEGFVRAFVWALAIDPTNPATLYAGTSFGGVIRSTNGGETWTAINAGLTSPYVYALAIDPSTPARLYAGTGGGGVSDYLGDFSCAPGPTTLCLSGGRFKVTTEWTTAAGQSGSGQAVALTEDTGYFTFFNRNNVEVAVKILNGCSSNGHFWTFAGGLTDVRVVMTVTDGETGAVKSYTNPQGTPFRPIQDTGAFETCAAGSTAGVRPYDGSVAGSLLPPSVSESFQTGVTEPCVANATTLCLSNSRYQVRAQWVTRDGATGAGQVIPLTEDTGAFWFFSPSNLEMVIKVLNGCAFNSRYWTFAGGLTDVNVILTVTDTQTGAIQTYTNPQGTPFEPIQDTNAFATCP